MHADLIDKLGGAAQLAADLGISSQPRVSNWKRRGIPWRFRVRVAALAKQRDVPVPNDFLIEAAA